MAVTTEHTELKAKFEKTLQDTVHTVEIDAQASQILEALGEDLKKIAKQLNPEQAGRWDIVQQAVRLDQAAHSLWIASNADLTVKSNTLSKVDTMRKEARDLANKLLEASR